MNAMLSRSLVVFCAVCGCLYVAATPPRLPDTDRVADGPPLLEVFGYDAYQRTSGSLQSRSDTLYGTTQVTYRWRNPHTVRIARWEGDTAILDPRVRSGNLDLTVKIDRQRMKQAIESFGIPESWFHIRARSQLELARKESALIAMAAARGILLRSDGNRMRVRVNHSWVVGKSTSDLRELAQYLSRITLSHGYRTQRQLLGILASFPQALKFQAPENIRLSEVGERVKTVGVTMPLETLYNGWGDCDTKSLLFASILANFPHQRAVFVMGSGHLFVGVRAVPRLNDHYIDIRGVKYILIEMSSPWPIGRVPQRHWTDCRRNQFRIEEVLSTRSTQPATSAAPGRDRQLIGRPRLPARLARSPESVANSKLRLANSYLVSGKRQHAIEILKSIVADYPQTQGAQRAQGQLIRLGVRTGAGMKAAGEEGAVISEFSSTSTDEKDIFTDLRIQRSRERL